MTCPRLSRRAQPCSHTECGGCQRDQVFKSERVVPPSAAAIRVDAFAILGDDWQTERTNQLRGVSQQRDCRPWKFHRRAGRSGAIDQRQPGQHASAAGRDSPRRFRFSGFGITTGLFERENLAEMPREQKKLRN